MRIRSKLSRLLMGGMVLSCLVSCSEFVETWVPMKAVKSVTDIAPTFTVEGVTFLSSPTTYEDIVSMVETMVENFILEIEVPYSGDFMNTDLYSSAYEYAYGEAYVQVNTTHIEYTCNTSTYVVGYRVKETGEHFILLSRSDKDFTQEEILYQGKYFQEEVTRMVEELWQGGQLVETMTELEQLEVIYRFVTDYLDYSYQYTPMSYTGYGALTERRAVCQGYVALFNSMVKKLGFTAEGVSGVVGIGMFAVDEGHIWSRVWVESQQRWVYFDPTFGDRSSFNEELGDLTYNMDYFDMSYDEMNHDRSTNRYGVNNAVLLP